MGTLLLLLGSYGGSATAPLSGPALLAVAARRQVASAGAVASAVRIAGAVRGSVFQPAAAAGQVKPLGAPPSARTKSGWCSGPAASRTAAWAASRLHGIRSAGWNLRPGA